MARIPDRSRLEQNPAFRDHLSSPDPGQRALAEGFLEFLDSYQAQPPRGLISDTRPKFMARPELAPGYEYVAVLLEASRQGGQEGYDPRQIPAKIAKALAKRDSTAAAIAGAALTAPQDPMPSKGPGEERMPRRQPIGDRPSEKFSEPSAKPQGKPAPKIPGGVKEVGPLAMVADFIFTLFGMGASTYGALKLSDPSFIRSINDNSPQAPVTLPPLWVYIPVKVERPGRNGDLRDNAAEGPQPSPWDAWTRLALEEYFSFTGKKSLSSEAEAQLFRDYLRAYLKRSGLPKVLIPDEMLLAPAEAASIPQKTAGRVQIVASTEGAGASAQTVDAASAANRKGAPAAPRIIYLISLPRSGSTALLRLFDETDQFISFNEPTVRAFSLERNPEFAKVLTKDGMMDHYDSVVQTILDAAHTGRVFVKDMAFSADALMDEQYDFVTRPDVQVIVLYRDPYSTLRSHRKLASLDGEDLEDVLSYSGLFEIVERLRRIAGRAPIVIRSEDFFANVVAASEDLFAQLGIPLESRQLQFPRRPVTELSERWHDPKPLDQIQFWHADAIDAPGISPLKVYTPEEDGGTAMEPFAWISDKAVRHRLSKIYVRASEAVERFVMAADTATQGDMAKILQRIDALEFEIPDTLDAGKGIQLSLDDINDLVNLFGERVRAGEKVVVRHELMVLGISPDSPAGEYIMKLVRHELDVHLEQLAREEKEVAQFLRALDPEEDFDAFELAEEIRGLEGQGAKPELIRELLLILARGEEGIEERLEEVMEGLGLRNGQALSVARPARSAGAYTDTVSPKLLETIEGRLAALYRDPDPKWRDNAFSADFIQGKWLARHEMDAARFKYLSQILDLRDIDAYPDHVRDLLVLTGGDRPDSDLPGLITRVKRHTYRNYLPKLRSQVVARLNQFYAEKGKWAAKSIQKLMKPILSKRSWKGHEIVSLQRLMDLMDFMVRQGDRLPDRLVRGLVQLMGRHWHDTHFMKVEFPRLLARIPKQLEAMDEIQGDLVRLHREIKDARKTELKLEKKTQLAGSRSERDLILKKQKLSTQREGLQSKRQSLELYLRHMQDGEVVWSRPASYFSGTRWDSVNPPSKDMVPQWPKVAEVREEMRRIREEMRRLPPQDIGSPEARRRQELHQMLYRLHDYVSVRRKNFVGCTVEGRNPKWAAEYFPGTRWEYLTRPWLNPNWPTAEEVQGEIVTISAALTSLEIRQQEVERDLRRPVSLAVEQAKKELAEHRRSIIYLLTQRNLLVQRLDRITAGLPFDVIGGGDQVVIMRSPDEIERDWSRLSAADRRDSTDYGDSGSNIHPTGVSNYLNPFHKPGADLPPGPQPGQGLHMGDGNFWTSGGRGHGKIE